MKIEYDPVVDALYVRFGETKIVESEQVQPGVIPDFDESGSVIVLRFYLSANAAPSHRNKPHRKSVRWPFAYRTTRQIASNHWLGAGA